MNNSNCPVCKAGNPPPGHWPIPQGEEVICDFHRSMIEAEAAAGHFTSYAGKPLPGARSPDVQLRDPKKAMLVIAVLVKRAGGRVRITQADIDAIAYNRILEFAVTQGDGSAAIDIEFDARRISG